LFELQQRIRNMRALRMAVRLASVLACFGAAVSLAGTPSGGFAGWRVERDVEPPSYAVIEPQSTNLNIDSVVLGCEEAGDRKVLQIQIYLSTEGPLSPNDLGWRRLKDDPRAEIVIDGRVFPVEILFADDYAVLGDETVDIFPALSVGLLDAMQTGTIMVLRFDIVAEPPGRPAAFDGAAMIRLQEGAGGSAVSALRRCSGPADRPGAVAFGRH
jgi:hypothetical protein